MIGFASWRARVKVLFDVGVGAGGLCEDCGEVWLMLCDFLLLLLLLLL